jgi:hypothetical protein
MSALIVGAGSHIGPIGDVLLDSGFDEIRYRNSDSIGSLDLNGYQPDMLILVKEAVKESDILRVVKKALELGIQVFLW